MVETAQNHKSESPAILELIARSKKGDAEAYGLLVRHFAPKAYGLALSFLGNHQDAEDVSQEAFIKVFNKLKGFEASGNFNAWLYTIVANMARNKLRWTKIRRKLTFSMDQSIDAQDSDDEAVFPQVAEPDGKTEPALQVERSWRSDRVRKALETLSEKQRTAVDLKFLQGNKISEVAEMMNLAEGTVKVHIFRGLQNLRKILEEEKA